MDRLKRKLETSIRWNNNISKESFDKNDPRSYTAFLLGQLQAYENVLKYIDKKQMRLQ